MLLFKQKILRSTICLFFLITCSKHVVNIPNEEIYIAEPTIYSWQKSIDIPVPAISDSNVHNLSNAIKTAVTRFVTDFAETYKPVGMGISVNTGGDTTLDYFTGYADQSRSKPVSKSTLFHSASSGKIIMATIIFSLIQDGSLDLNDTISNWFEDETLFDGVTIDHLLSHTSGIVSFEFIREFSKDKRVWSEEELVRLVLNKQKQKLFVPGEAFHYSNTGYVMLGMIAQRVSNRSLEELFNERIKDKAGLENAFYLSESGCSIFTSASFNINSEFIPLPEPSYASGPHGAGAFAGPPSEFTCFLNALLLGKIIHRPVLNLMFSNFRLCEGSAQSEVYYGRGIQLIRIIVPGKESDYIGHSGRYTGFGFTSQLYHCINRNITISIMTNQEVETQPLIFRISEEFPAATSMEKN